jgi:hypothetical protein
LVNAAEFRSSRSAVLLLAALLLTAAAVLRGAEYDEQYTLFLTAGTPRPDWPEVVFPAGAVAAMQSGHATLAGIARDLRATDVHPPLYFWAVSLWRAVFGPALLAARMLSVACGVASLGLVGVIARRSLIPPVLAMLLCLGCYSFVYTNAIARGFAPAQLLTLCGVALLLGRRPILAGISLGAACCCNYLAAFVAAAAIIATGAWVAVPAAVPFLALDAWFFAAQHATRSGQFVPFAIGPSLVRLAEYQTAAVFGGLPLYVNDSGRIAAEAVIGLVSVTVVLCVARARLWQEGGRIRLMVLAAAAPPVGLLLLGAAFDNTPIELRYLSFGAPFIALMIAWALNGPARMAFTTRILLPLVFGLQFAGIAGLLLSPRTMQPASGAAIAATRLARDAIVLVPRGNDGVGIVGAFGIAASPALPILLIRPTDAIAGLIAPYHRVAVAALAQDRDSIEAVSLLRAALAAPNWRRVANGSNLEVYERADKGE